MLDLLIKQVTEGLSPDEQRALDGLDGAAVSAHLEALERAAAAVSLAASAGAEPPPPALVQALLRQAERHVTASAGSVGATRSVPDGSRLGDELPGRGTEAPRGAAPGSPPSPASLPRPAGRAEGVARAHRPFFVGGAYGWLAAAACLVFAFFAWNRRPVPPPATVLSVPPAEVKISPPKPLPPPPVPSADEERAALLAKADAIKVTLGATKDPAAAGVSGDVVWDPVAQRGFVHLVGLAPNDPSQRQYQLWIFDGNRDKRYPVDGGVFDIPAGANEAVIPIHAELAIGTPKAFAVTVEKPGGVVVSGREHVVALGAAG